MNDTNVKIVFEYYSVQQQTTTYYQFPSEILKFNIEILNNDHNQPYPIPKQIVDSQYPFDVIKQFLQAHSYDSDKFKIIKPINSSNFEDLVDPQTYSVCSKFTSLQNSQKAILVVNLCRYMRFHQLHDAICAAIATNYYIPPNNQQALEQFKKKNKIDDLSTQQTCQIIRQYEEVFNIIQAKAKQQFVKNYPELIMSQENQNNQ